MNYSPGEPALELATRLKDGLRTIRYGVRQSHAHLRDIGPEIPGPLAATLDKAAMHADGTVQRLGHATSRMARRVMFKNAVNGILPSPLATWNGTTDGLPAERAADFARAAYRALTGMLDRLGATRMLIFEYALQSALQSTLQSGIKDNAASQHYAALAIAMIRARAIAGIDFDTEAPLLHDINRFCAVALSLAMAASEQDQDAAPDELLDAAARLAKALWPEIESANEAQIAHFIERYAARL